MIEVIEWAFSSGYAPETDPPDTPPPIMHITMRTGITKIERMKTLDWALCANLINFGQHFQCRMSFNLYWANKPASSWVFRDPARNLLREER